MTSQQIPTKHTQAAGPQDHSWVLGWWVMAMVTAVLLTAVTGGALAPLVVTAFGIGVVGTVFAVIDHHHRVQ